METARTVRVLTIGNSFADNACRYLPAIMAGGNVQLVLGSANLPGCTLERHASLARQYQNDKDARPYERATNRGIKRLSLQEYLEEEAWDYVSVQQHSALSYRVETFHPHIDELVQLIRKQSPQTQLLVHETWAYRPDAPFFKERSFTQTEMYDGLRNAYAHIAKQFDAKLIPVGSAFQEVRSTLGRKVIVPDPAYDFGNPLYPKLPDQLNSLVVGWRWRTRRGERTLRLDYKHANESGCFLAGLVWYETITGLDARENRFHPPGMKPYEAKFYREAAHRTVEKSDSGSRQ